MMVLLMTLMKRGTIMKLKDRDAKGHMDQNDKVGYRLLYAFGPPGQSQAACEVF